MVYSLRDDGTAKLPRLSRSNKINWHLPRWLELSLLFLQLVPAGASLQTSQQASQPYKNQPLGTNKMRQFQDAEWPSIFFPTNTPQAIPLIQPNLLNCNSWLPNTRFSPRELLQLRTHPWKEGWFIGFTPKTCFISTVYTIYSMYVYRIYIYIYSVFVEWFS